MKTKITLLTALILLLWASPAMGIEPEKQGFWASRDPWTKEQIKWQIACTSITAFDLYQTGIVLDRGGYESSPFVTPFIGEKPTKKELYQFGLKWMVLQSTVAHVLPSKYRNLWLKTVFWITTFEVSISDGTELAFKKIF